MSGRVGRALRRLRTGPDPTPAAAPDPKPGKPAAVEVDPEADVALNESIPWAELAGRDRDGGTVSVVMLTYRDIDLTTKAVRAVSADAPSAPHRVQLLVVDNGCPPRIATQLDDLVAQHPGTEIVHNAVNHGFSLGNNLALDRVEGGTVVFLNNDTEVQRGWLGPLLAALEDPAVVGAQSLLVYPSGEVQSAGIAFPPLVGPPHALLAGCPVEAAQGLRGARLQAATAAALAMRTADVIALHGFDAWFRNGMEDADLGLRAGRDLGGHFVLCPDSVVVHHESKTPGRYAHAMRNRRQFLDRWAGAITADDAELWRLAGYDVVGHERREAPTDDRDLWVPMPVVRPVADVEIVLIVGSETKAVVRTLHRLADTWDADLNARVTVVANGSPTSTRTAVEALRERIPGLDLVVLPTALDRTAAFARTVASAGPPLAVALQPGVEPQPGWLAPLVRAFDDPEVLGAAPVLRALDGTVVSAGPAFPPGRAPEPFLAGFPLEDVAFLADHPLSAVAGPAVAFRVDDLGELGASEVGDALAWADVSLSLAARRPGRFVTCVHSSVVVRNPAEPTAEERATFAARWPTGPADRDDLWRRAGFEVTPSDLRRLPLTVREGVPCLRWAIKNPATALRRGEHWGDTYFCRRLAEALRRLGQTVAIDHREAFDRPTGRFDDVTLVVRGLTPHTPTPGAVNLAWLISHPELMDAAEAASYDRLFAAGPAWAAAKAQEWGIRIDPLLQATDPGLFHPDRAAPDSGPPILFVGSARDGQREIVRQATAAGLAVTVWGGGWEGHLPPAQIAGDYLANEDVGAAYRAAGIVLNDHWPDMREGGFVSNRVFDAAGAGARLITDDVAGLSDLAAVFGRSVQVATSPADIARLAADLTLFGDDAERRAVAERVHAAHSFDVRARVLLDAALELRAT